MNDKVIYLKSVEIVGVKWKIMKIKTVHFEDNCK